MILLNPGPVTMTARVRAALAAQDVCHREPEFAALVRGVREKIGAIYGAPGYVPVLVGGSGTAAVETMLSVVPRDGNSLVVANGVYGERMAAMLRAQGKRHEVVTSPWTSGMDLEAVEKAITGGSFGHVLAVRKLLKTQSLVVLWMLGGLTIYRGAPRPGQQAAISLMGPAFSIVLGGLSYAALLWLPPAPPLVHAFLVVMVWINVVWTAANLLPALPLDGGQALRAGLRAGIGREKADPIMRAISLGTSAAIIGAGLWLAEPVAVVLGAFLLLDNLKPTGVAYH